MAPPVEPTEVNSYRAAKWVCDVALQAIQDESFEDFDGLEEMCSTMLAMPDLALMFRATLNLVMSYCDERNAPTCVDEAAATVTKMQRILRVHGGIDASDTADDDEEVLRPLLEWIETRREDLTAASSSAPFDSPKETLRPDSSLESSKTNNADSMLQTTKRPTRIVLTRAMLVSTTPAQSSCHAAASSPDKSHMSEGRTDCIAKHDCVLDDSHTCEVALASTRIAGGNGGHRDTGHQC